MNCAEDKLDAAYENLPTEKKLVRKKQYLNQENTEKPQNLTSKQQKPTFHAEELDKKPKYRQKFHQAHRADDFQRGKCASRQNL